MTIISVVITLFGLFGVAASLYLRFTVQSPILSTKDGGEIHIGALSLQQILNTIFAYLAVLHLIIALIGVNFLLS